MGIRKIAVLFFIFSSVLTAAYAEKEKASRPCKKEDLVGTWDMVLVKPVFDKNDAVFYPYQRFEFSSNSSMKSMSSEKTFTQEWLDKFRKQAPEVDFSLSDRSVLTMTWNARPHSESAICAYVMKDVPPEALAKIPENEHGSLPRKGNVTLSFLDSGGKIAYRKILSRVA